MRLGRTEDPRAPIELGFFDGHAAVTPRRSLRRRERFPDREVRQAGL